MYLRPDPDNCLNESRKNSTLRRTGRYIRHMFREGREIIPSGGWFKWTGKSGKGN